MGRNDCNLDALAEFAAAHFGMVFNGGKLVCLTFDISLSLQISETIHGSLRQLNRNEDVVVTCGRNNVAAYSNLS